ncbi:MAG TPA: GMC family oxidoreductase [Candidatus Salinicoccus stercoripullorum]|uniref:GMC family oxidoreductase n=1 Tax=Candidatus Salinicoccus stercoripullorum TaxID=2838756 RepID=A0A9D1QI77_9STAP|nr:GMC family oxidoreductase [Candidatus Salinicoccus stercoripullorum]
MAETLDKREVVVVGLGWAGSIIAAELAKEGKDVLGLERGEEKTTENYLTAHDEYRYVVGHEMMQDLSKETLTYRNNLDEEALPMRRFGAFLIGTDVGGGGVHWNGDTWMYNPYDFEIKSRTDEKYGADKLSDDYLIQDWGITYDELLPYYEKFEATAGISGEQNPMGPERRKDYPTPPMKMTPLLSDFKAACEAAGTSPFRTPAGNMSQEYTNPDGQTLAACQYCGFCEKFGCEWGAKSSPIVTTIPTAKESGNFEIKTRANVVEIMKDGDEVTGVLYVDTTTHKEYIQPADVVVITSHTTNNTKLLLHSDLGTPYDPETGDGNVGRNYCLHITPSVTGFFDKEYNMSMGAGALGVTIDDYNNDNFDHSDHDFIHGASISMKQQGKRPILENAVPDGVKNWGAEFKNESIKAYNRSASAWAQMITLPYVTNYLSLDPTYKDEWGRPLLRLTYDVTDHDRKAHKFIGDRIEEIIDEMNPVAKTRAELDDHFDILPAHNDHIVGGTIMGADPETSVVNNYLQMWDADNVFVIGGSNFPHNGGYNPTGTVGALAYRAAEGISQFLDDKGPLVDA